jgi:hypothetical protein
VRRLVDAQRLDPEPTDGVGREVQREGAAVAEPEPAVGPQHEAGDNDVPEQLVEERRVERREGLVVVGSVHRVDLERPRHGRGAAEQLLVEPVAEPADRLRQDDAGATASPKAPTEIPRRRQPIHVPRAPNATAPQIPRPPSQIARALAGSPPSPKYGPGVVITW